MSQQKKPLKFLIWCLPCRQNLAGIRKYFFRRRKLINFRECCVFDSPCPSIKAILFLLRRPDYCGNSAPNDRPESNINDILYNHFCITYVHKNIKKPINKWLNLGEIEHKICYPRVITPNWVLLALCINKYE